MNDEDSGGLETYSPMNPPPLSAEELRHLRQMLLEDSHATWLRKKVKVFLPWAIAIGTGLAGLYHAFVGPTKH
jgi:hypothetical protein